MAIESASNDLKKALETNDAKAITRTLDALNAAQQKAGENLYKTAGAAAPGAGPEAGPSSEPTSGNGKADDVIDAEVVEEKK
jgi:molecular chaperone DnaK